VIELPALRIRAVGARGLDLALARPVETATGTMRTGPLVLIDLATEEGIVGRCYLRCYTPVALQPLVQLVANLGDLVRGDAAAPEAVEQKLQRHLRLLGPQGLTGIAVAGIDMALWDACAKAAHMSLVRLLGGDPTPLPAHASLRTMRPMEPRPTPRQRSHGASPRSSSSSGGVSWRPTWRRSRLSDGRWATKST
jgi:mandelate racemase